MTVAELVEAPPPGVRRTRALVRAAAAASVVLLVAGVLGLAVHDAGTSVDRNVLGRVTAAAARTVSAKSAKFTAETATSIGGTATPATSFSASGAFDFVQKRGTAQAQIGPFGTVDIVVVGSTEYIKLPDALRKGASVSTPWLSVDMAALVNQAGSLGGSTPSLPGGGDPAAILGQLQATGAVKQATEVGNAKVRGADTTHYRAVLDGEKLKGTLTNVLGSLPPVNNVKLEDPVADLWVDKDGMVRRQVVVVASRLGSGSRAVRVENTTTTELFDFGSPVTATVPPSTQVTQLGSLAQLFQMFGPGG
ncbi:MAG TPA: hypothetical protein VFA94_17155 [Acidimicrobiales bacterium]|nr:hypothetical protein [Acidimicrobiales bacterium]